MTVVFFFIVLNMVSYGGNGAFQVTSNYYKKLILTTGVNLKNGKRRDKE